MPEGKREPSTEMHGRVYYGERMQLPISMNTIIGGLLALIVVLWLVGF